MRESSRLFGMAVIVWIVAIIVIGMSSSYWVSLGVFLMTIAAGLYNEHMRLFKAGQSKSEESVAHNDHSETIILPINEQQGQRLLRLEFLEGFVRRSKYGKRQAFRNELGSWERVRFIVVNNAPNVPENTPDMRQYLKLIGKEPWCAADVSGYEI